MTMLSVDQAASKLGLSKSFLDKKRVRGGGPRYLKLGRRVLYDPRDLESWIEARRRHNTSEESAGA